MALGKDYRTVNASSGTISGGIAIALGGLLSHHDLRTFKEGRDKALGMIQCVMS